MILLIDNYDSFVHNLARYFGRMGLERRVVRNDAATVEEIAVMRPEAVVISPGPGAPRGAGVCLDLIRRLHREIPILGICLGHQCIGEAFGGSVSRVAQPMHGRASDILHDGSDMFAGMSAGFRGARYHSLAVTLPPRTDLTISAQTEDGTIMALRHGQHPMRGLQFHPESVLTDGGEILLKNFMTLARHWNAGAVKAAA